MAYDSPSSKKGVGGWLLFLCVALTFFTPIGILAGLGAAINLSEQTKDSFPTFSNAVMIAGLGRLVLAVLSVRAGVLLWKEKPAAVTKAQRFFITYATYLILLVGVAYVGELPHAAQESVRNAYLVSALQTLVFAVIWHQYLSRTVRVRNTFQS